MAQQQSPMGEADERQSGTKQTKDHSNLAGRVGRVGRFGRCRLSGEPVGLMCADKLATGVCVVAAFMSRGAIRLMWARWLIAIGEQVCHIRSQWRH